MINREWISNHESAHAAAAVLVGIPPIRIVVGMPPPVFGEVRFQHHYLSPTLAPKFFLIIAAGYIGNGEDPPRWPVSPEMAASTDQEKLRLLAKYLDLDASGYAGLVIDSWKLAARREFGLLELAFTTALGHRSILDAPQIADVLLAALETEQVAELYGVPTNTYEKEPALVA